MVPYGSKNAHKEFSSVLNPIPWAKISSLPAFSAVAGLTSPSCLASSVAAGASALADPLSLDPSESEPDPDPDPEDEAAFLAAFFGAGLSLLSESEDDEAAFLAAFLAGALAGGFDDSELSESESDELSTFYFLAGAAFAFPLLPALAALLPLTFEVALALLAITGTFFSDSEESESESLESLLLSCFFFFLESAFLAAS